ncbi:Chemotaxis response regulator protein-glutamate methylesterase [bioreactor metagenome]|uniref:protein-glutamate methylesterase n=1 Tax=bioreactor metagenome TaxID=1076179 RepID=A0A644Z3I7_9ZZZZ|nr:chemotaxis response regulator protein-glutamate methylesterase [Oscillospiraceae bacterium]
MREGKIRVLVIDDSILSREILSRGLSTDPQIEVVAKASDPFDARDKILTYEPDVITCDIEMPKMNGIEFVKKLIPQYPVPVIVVSSLSDAVFDALNAGAVDFVTKPNEQSAKSVEAVINDLINKVKIASKAKVRFKRVRDTATTDVPIRCDHKRIIGIGASTGGTEALFHVLKKLPPSIPGIVIVQHIPPVFSAMFADRMNTQTALNVKEAQDGDSVETGKVLIAPGDKHMRVKKIGDKYKVDVFMGNEVNGHRPSVDVLFDSMAAECGKSAVGVILTGMGQDGAKGILKMRNNGAITIGQDEKTSVVYGMPKIAYEIGGVERQLGLDDIPDMIINVY